MKQEEFIRREVRERLDHLSKKDIVYFAWYCAIQALPFLGVTENFNYWNGKKIQENLFSVFNALDVAYAYVFDYSSNSTDIISFSDAVYAASYASTYATATYATYVADAADLAYTTYFAYADLCHTNWELGEYKEDFQQKILITLDALKSKDNKKIPLFENIPNPFLNSFIESLYAVGCGYWAELYKKLFANNLIMDDSDIKELKRRLSVPKAIRKKGATAVGKWLQRDFNEAEKSNTNGFWKGFKEGIPKAIAGSFVALIIIFLGAFIRFIAYRFGWSELLYRILDFFRI